MPSPEEVARIRSAQERAEQRRKEDLAHALEPAVTLDGTRIEVLANIGGLKDATQIAALGGEGVGLLRSEFLFMERADAPTRRGAVRDLQGHRAGASGPSIRSSSARSTSAATSRSPTCRFRRRTIRSSASAACASASIVPEILRTQLRAILRAAAVRQGAASCFR